VDSLSYKTIFANDATAKKQWYVVDAEGQTLGRLAAEVAKTLRGKYKTDFTPNTDAGDNVIIVNAEKIQLTGKKMSDKQYVSYTGYPGGQRFTNPAALLKTHPERVIEKAVKGMLPKNRLGKQIFGNLYVYAGSEHKHEAQQPKELKLNK